MPTICFAGFKGGIGKSTCSLAIAEWIGRATPEDPMISVVVDLDPQGTATSWHEDALDDDPLSIPVLPIVTRTPAGIADEVRKRTHGYRYVFIDTPPGNEDITDAGVRCSDLVVIPTAPTMTEMKRVQYMIELAQESETPVAVLFNRTRSGTNSREMAREIMSEFDNVHVFDSEVPLRESVAMADGTALSKEVLDLFKDPTEELLWMFGTGGWVMEQMQKRSAS